MLLALAKIVDSAQAGETQDCVRLFEIGRALELFASAMAYCSLYGLPNNNIRVTVRGSRSFIRHVGEATQLDYRLGKWSATRCRTDRTVGGAGSYGVAWVFVLRSGVKRRMAKQLKGREVSGGYEFRVGSFGELPDDFFGD